MCRRMEEIERGTGVETMDVGRTSSRYRTDLLGSANRRTETDS